MRFPSKITSSCIWVAIPVDWVILHWYACDADGRTVGLAVGRCTVTWLPNFLGWVDYYIFSPMVLRCARFARESSAIRKTNWADPSYRFSQWKVLSTFWTTSIGRGRGKWDRQGGAKCLVYENDAKAKLEFPRRRVLPIMGHTGRPRPKAVPFLGFRYIKG